MEKSAGPKVRCKGCGDVIQSMHRHDMVYCTCRRIAVDGGSSYLRMMFTDSPDDYEVLRDEGETLHHIAFGGGQPGLVHPDAEPKVVPEIRHLSVEEAKAEIARLVLGVSGLDYLEIANKLSLDLDFTIQVVDAMVGAGALRAEESNE